jgi:hypothetical protein
LSTIPGGTKKKKKKKTKKRKKKKKKMLQTNALQNHARLILRLARKEVRGQEAHPRAGLALGHDGIARRRAAQREVAARAGVAAVPELGLDRVHPVVPPPRILGQPRHKVARASVMGAKRAVGFFY